MYQQHQSNLSSLPAVVAGALLPAVQTPESSPPVADQASSSSLTAACAGAANGAANGAPRISKATERSNTFDSLLSLLSPNSVSLMADGNDQLLGGGQAQNKILVLPQESRSQRVTLTRTHTQELFAEQRPPATKQQPQPIASPPSASSPPLSSPPQQQQQPLLHLQPVHTDNRLPQPLALFDNHHLAQQNVAQCIQACTGVLHQLVEMVNSSIWQPSHFGGVIPQLTGSPFLPSQPQYNPPAGSPYLSSQPQALVHYREHPAQHAQAQQPAHDSPVDHAHLLLQPEVQPHYEQHVLPPPPVANEAPAGGGPLQPADNDDALAVRGVKRTFGSSSSSSFVPFRAAPPVRPCDVVKPVPRPRSVVPQPSPPAVAKTTRPRRGAK